MNEPIAAREGPTSDDLLDALDGMVDVGVLQKIRNLDTGAVAFMRADLPLPDGWEPWLPEHDN